MSGAFSTPALPDSPRGVRDSVAASSAHRLLRLVAAEDSDLPARLAIAGSALAAVFSLGNYLIAPSFLSVFPYLVTRTLLYGSTLLGGCIIAAGFLSKSRSANYTAVVATVAIVGSYLGRQIGMTAPVFHTLSIAYGIALLGGVITWSLRALRRHFGDARA